MAQHFNQRIVTAILDKIKKQGQVPYISTSQFSADLLQLKAEKDFVFARTTVGEYYLPYDEICFILGTAEEASAFTWE